MQSLEEDVKDQKRLTDQMLSAYSVLRDRYQRRSISLALALLGSAVILNALTFASSQSLIFIGIDANLEDFLIRCFSVLVFLLSLVELRIDWTGKARLYGHAADQLAVLKGVFSTLGTVPQDEDTTKLADASRKYQATMAILPRIPEKQFLPLKAYHRRKVEASKRLDKYPGRPLWLIRLEIWHEGLWKKG